jgi:hypothetical protein
MARRRPGEESKRTPTPFSDLAALQRAAGNEAVTSLIEGDKGPPVQRDLMEYAKDAYHHAKDAVTSKKEGGEEGGSEWEKPSEEVALHAREAFDLASAALKKSAASVKSADPQGAAETLEYAEGFDKASELVKTGGEVFEKGVKAVKIIQATAELRAAIQEVNSHDVLSDPAGSAKAFDNLFTATGEFATGIAPKGPWTGYFELLKHFNDNGGFFTNVGAEMRLETGPEAHQLKEIGMDPAKNNRWSAQPSAPVAEKVSLNKLSEDVTDKVNRLKATTRLADLDVGLDDFTDRYRTFVDAWQAYDHLSFMSKLRGTELATTTKAALNKAADDVIYRLQGFQREASGSDVSFQPDIDTLVKVKD